MLRSLVSSLFESGLPALQANLMTSIMIGGKELDSKLLNELANTGLTHVVAASGMNLTLIVGMLLMLFSKIHAHKIVKVLIGYTLILFYSSITGFDPPIVRAGIMGALVLMAEVVGRKTSGFYTLGAAACIMLWVNPELSTNPSFLLSFTAMTGQIWLSTKSDVLPEHKNPVIGFASDTFLQTMVATVFTLPIVAFFFSRFSLLSPLTNLLVLWTIEPLMILGGLIVVFGLLFTPFTWIISVPAKPLLDYFLWVVNFFGNNDHFVLRVNINSTLFIAGYYLFLAGILLRKKQ